MKKLFYKFMNFCYRIKFKLQAKRFKVTPRGEYTIKYLIDRYINCTISEDNESYEKDLRAFIQKHVDKVPDTLLKNAPEILRDDLKEYHCIFAYLCSLLLFTPDRQEWIDYITNTKIRSMIIKTIGE